MKVTRTGWDQFIVWRFQMEPGDIKDFQQREMERNLEMPEVVRAMAEGIPMEFEKTVTLNSIAVFVNGKFEFRKDGYPPTIKTRGNG